MYGHDVDQFALVNKTTRVECLDGPARGSGPQGPRKSLSSYLSTKCGVAANGIREGRTEKDLGEWEPIQNLSK